MRSLPVNVELLVQRVVDTMAPVVWRSSRIEVVADIAPVAPTFPRVLADENRLEQILQNLLHNAVRHTAPGGIIVLGVRADEQSVILQVKDTGEGIAPEELEHIWKRFYRAENARNQPGSGSGLGLAIVRDLTEAMGGTVAATSTVGQGSIFTICLPRLGTGALLGGTRK
jgi:signal transduction histidine kinase